MTLIVALVGEGDAVLAADSKGRSGDGGGYYASTINKLKRVNKNWILGVAGSQNGLDMYDTIRIASDSFSPDIHVGASQYALRMRELYKQQEYKDSSSFFLAGAGEKYVAIYRWTLERASDGTVDFSGVNRVIEKDAIGAELHGALYFAYAFHKPAMGRAQRISLAHLCVTEACKQDPRVGLPVEVGLVCLDRDPQLFSADHLREVAEHNREIISEFHEMILEAHPQIDGL